MMPFSVAMTTITKHEYIFVFFRFSLNIVCCLFHFVQLFGAYVIFLCGRIIMWRIHTVLPCVTVRWRRRRRRRSYIFSVVQKYAHATKFIVPLPMIIYLTISSAHFISFRFFLSVVCCLVFTELQLFHLYHVCGAQRIGALNGDGVGQTPQVNNHITTDTIIILFILTSKIIIIIFIYRLIFSNLRIFH